MLIWFFFTKPDPEYAYKRYANKQNKKKLRMNIADVRNPFHDLQFKLSFIVLK